MCGIVGIVGPYAHNKKELLCSMRDIMTHRGPDDQGDFFESHVALGHRRLSIVDLSPLGKNPMHSNNGRYVITYNGEVFNYLELRSEIGNRYKFRTKTDTEVVLASYIVWGKNCVQKFIGMFAFAIWDRQEKVIFCARDRFGIKPFYYLSFQDHFYFASEIKALLLTTHLKEADLQTVHQYLNFGFYDHDESTFFKDVKRLLPGHTLTYENQKISLESYWDLADFDMNVQNEASTIDKIYATLEDSTSLALRSDVAVGVNLSGGLDSSILTVFLDKILGKNNKITGFTQDYRDARFSERSWVEEIAHRTQRTVHFSYMDEQDFLKSHQVMQWYQDEPYAGVPVVGYVGMYQGAKREKIKVLLDGNGMDECFGGYRHYHNTFLSKLKNEQEPQYNQYVDEYAKEWDVPVSKAHKQINQIHLANTLSRDGTKSVHHSWLNSDFKYMFNLSSDLFKTPFKSTLKNTMYQDLRYTKIPRALRFNDRVSMAFSRELRVPFLDHRLFELSFSLSDKVLFMDSRPKGILRRGMCGKIPDKVRLAPKRHIQTPQNIWFETSLRSYVGDILHSRSFMGRGFFDVKSTHRIFNSLKGKPLENSFFLWQAINLETWFDMFIDTPSIVRQPEKFPVYDYETLNCNKSI